MTRRRALSSLLPLLGAYLAGAGPIRAAAPEAALPRLPFEFSLDAEDQPRYASPDSEGASSSPPGAGRRASVRLHWKQGTAARTSERIDVFQQRKGDAGWPRWKWTGARTSRSSTAVLTAAPGWKSVVVWRRPGDGEGSYAISPAFSWPSEDGDIDMDRDEVRTLRGEIPGEDVRGRWIFVGEPVKRDSGDLLCETDGGRKWQCLAVPRVAGAVALCRAGDSHAASSSAAVGATQSGELRLERSDWAAPVFVTVPESGRGEPPPQESDGSVSFALSASAGGNGQLRVTAPARVDRIGRNLYWVRGALGPMPRLEAHLGRSSGLVEENELAEGDCGEILRLSLNETRGVRGRVLAESGTPLARASVLLLEPGSSREGRSDSPPVLAASTLSDENGRFAFEDAPSRSVRVRGCHPAAGCADRDVSPLDGEIDLTLTPRWLYSGRLLSSSGVPVPGAHLRFLPTLEHFGNAPDRLLILPTEVDAQSDPEGRFQIAPAGPGSFLLEARHEGIGSARRSIEVHDGTSPRTDLGNIILSGAGQFLARVAGSSGADGGAGSCRDGSLAFAGPVGATSLPAVRDFPLDAGGVAVIDLPETGAWLVWARCGGSRRDVEPAILPNVEELYGGEVRLTVKPSPLSPPPPVLSEVPPRSPLR